VRELTMLDRLDASRLKVLVIQYTDKTYGKLDFERDADNLPIMSQAAYQNIVQHYASQRPLLSGQVHLSTLHEALAPRRTET